MLRIVLLISLLATLIIMISQFSSAPLPEPQVAPVRPKTRPLPLPAGKESFARKSLVRPTPEVYDGYLFAADRKLEDADFGEFGHGSQVTEETGGAGLEQVFYVGSLIVGERRQGMITYREENINSAMARVRPGSRGAAYEEQTKVLVVGDRFRGYEVTVIEPDKIVFTKGGEKVEKFLYDQNKQRSVAPVAQPRPAPVPAASGAATVTPPAHPAPNARLVPPATGGRASTATVRTTRSRRFQRRYPTTRLPMPVSPTQPDSPNNQPETGR